MDNVATKETASLMGLIDTYKRWKHFDTYKDRKYFYYHPSEWGYCLRKQQYMHYAQMGYIDVEYKPLPSKLLRLFDKGHNMHDRWSRYFDDIGNCLMGHWQCKNPLCHLFKDNGVIFSNRDEDVEEAYKKSPRIYKGDADKPIFRPKKCVCGCTDFQYLETPVFKEDLKIKGSADLVLNFDNFDSQKFKDVKIMFDKKYLPTDGKMIVGDMKTTSSSAWKNQVTSKGPHKYYQIQITFYIHVLGCEYGLIMYENKDTSEMMWFQVEKNQEWWDLISWQAGQMIEMRENRLLPPPKAKEKRNYMCCDCTFKSLCHKSKVWDDPNLTKNRASFYQCFL